MARRLVIDLDDFDGFKAHPLVNPIRKRFDQDVLLAEQAIVRLIECLEELNQDYVAEFGRVALSSVQGRVKDEDRFLKKLLRACREQAASKGVSPETMEVAYSSIKDIAGVRFSCPYFDEVVPAIENLVRPGLAASGFGSNLRHEAGYEDKDFLEDGDAFGYRSYHFYVRIPTVVDIYGNIQPCLCEVQARTELQHVWADKSHDLLYKPSSGLEQPDEHVVALMKQVSNNLRVADELLVDIRRRIRRESDR